MPLFELQTDRLEKIPETTFESEGIKERYDLQRLLRSQIEIVAPNTLIIAEEYGSFEGSRRSIDLLGVDKTGDLVVIELKRTNDGGHMDLQSLRYAAMVSNMTLLQAVDTYRSYLSARDEDEGEAESRILEFLDWESADEDSFAASVKIVLVSAEFSKEITTTAMWLSSHEIDIRCVRIKPHRLDNRIIVDVQQIVPLPEANDYLVKIREKSREERASREHNRDFTKFNLTLGNQDLEGLPKRAAIYELCRYLCAQGITPKEISQHIPRTFERVWYALEGKHESEEFISLAVQEAAKGGRAFDRSRWYCGEGELIYSGDATYAFLNQWGGPKWAAAMAALTDHFSHLNISYSPEDFG